MNPNSKGLLDTFNMQSLEDIMAETEDLPEDDLEEEDEIASAPVPVAGAYEGLMTRKEMVNTDFGKKMDEVYGEAMDIARKVADMGMNIDPSKAPRMFEVAAQHLKVAIDASATKRETELKLMKLMQDQEKLKLEELKTKHLLGDADLIKGDVVMVEDRNKLLELLRSQKS